jgi:hypothetical protein
LSHKVRTHTRQVNGKTVTVRQHRQEDPAAAQRKRHNFERRVQRERQQADAQALRDRQQSEAIYAPPGSTRTTRTPGERKRRKKNGWTRAKGHARKARRLWRRHKVRAAAHGLAALGWAAGHATRRTAAKARKLYRQWRKGRKKT